MTLGLPPIFGCLWHVLRLDRRRFCENGTRTDVGPLSSPPPPPTFFSALEQLPRRDD